MKAVTISHRHQVTIPKKIRDRLRLEPGQQLQALAYGDRVELIPVRSARSLRGFLRGIDSQIERDAP